MKVSLVIPTYNERDGLKQMVASLSPVLERTGLDYEIVIVDDNSPDGTGALADELANEFKLLVVHRAGKLGLSSAVIDGWSRATGNLLGVMDADGSHDANILPAMVRAVATGGADVAVGSRYVPGGGMGDWPLRRQLISRVACVMGGLICPVKDVTSGFLVFRREVIEGVTLDPIGFKIGLEVLVRGKYRTFTETPYVFTDRKAGQSKLDFKVIRQYLIQLWRLVWFSLRNRAERVRIASS